METRHNHGDIFSPMEPSELIRRERERLGISQKSLADAVGISQPAIRKIEAGETKKSKHLPEIYRFLRIPFQVEGPQAMLADSVNDDPHREALLAAIEGSLSQLVNVDASLLRKAAETILALAEKMPSRIGDRDMTGIIRSEAGSVVGELLRRDMK